MTKTYNVNLKTRDSPIPVEGAEHGYRTVPTPGSDEIVFQIIGSPVESSELVKFEAPFEAVEYVTIEDNE